MTKQKKPNKKRRDELRARDADNFNKGFQMGYEMGIEQGRRDMMTSGLPSLWDGGTPAGIEGHFKNSFSE